MAKHLNTDCKRMLALGASTGKLITEYKKAGWSVTGYDYSPVAVNTLNAKGISAKLIDLNERDETGKLSYEAQLIEDTAAPVNILLIRILQYMNLDALNLLLFSLIDNTATGSIIFIAGNFKNSNTQHSTTTAITPYTRWYKATFFAARTDMEFLESKQVNVDDEVLVIRKR